MVDSSSELASYLTDQKGKILALLEALNVAGFFLYQDTRS